MADITITAANVLAASNATTVDVNAGETVTAGQLVYIDAADGEAKLVDNDAEATSEVKGVALNGADDGQPLEVCTRGNLNPGATVVVGTIYCSSSTAGGIAPAADLATGDFTTILGVATTAANIYVSINNSGVAVPA